MRWSLLEASVLKLTYSNNLKKLVVSLIGNSPALSEGGTKLLFSPPLVIVPNRNLKAWLSFEIARVTGIAANIRFQYLEDFLQSVLTDHEKSGIIIDRSILQSALVALFQAEGRADLPSEVSTYLASADSPDERDLRAYQLASQLSRVFEEYSLSRGSMLRKWKRGEPALQREPFFSTERWQRAVWNMILGRGGSLAQASDSNGRRLISYAEALEHLPQRGNVFSGELHLFGFSYLSRAYLTVVAEIARSRDVCCYSLNPCQEYWEDVRSRSEELREKAQWVRLSRKVPLSMLEESEDPFDLDNALETPALRLWGRPGREHIHILNSITECNFTEMFDDPLDRGATLLHQLQHDILFRKPERSEPVSAPDFSSDTSIRILACPGVQREVEIVANEIWSLVMSDTLEPPLRFNEIAVIIADSGLYDRYCTHISSVFREIHDIPHSVSDTSLAKDSRIGEAVLLLLELPLGPFRREDVLRLITHPSVIARFPEADPDEWILWTEKTGIFHGQDRRSHAETYIEKDLYNWDQGIKRLSLGAFLSGLRSGSEKPFSADAPGGDAYLPEEFGPGSMPNAALAVALCRSLFADARFAVEQRMTFGEWAAFFQAFVTTYIGTVTEDDEQAFSRCLGVIAALRERQIDDTRVSYRIACEFIRHGLSELTGNKGQYLARGVSVSSFLPMRPIPFRVVFILGLGEGRFPARDMRNPLDLRGARRMPGDVTARERDQYMFLETLISTQERLYLSYVSRDSQTGEPIEPSSVIKELQFMLERGYIGSEGMKRMVVMHPLRRFSPEYFPGFYGTPETGLPNYSPEARREAEIAAVRHAIIHAGKSALPDLRSIEKQLPQRVRQLLGLRQNMPESCCEEKPLVRIPLRTIRRFLECPLQGWAAFQLGLREEDFQDPLVGNEEALETVYPDALVLQRSAFVQSWNRASGSSSFPEIVPEVYGELVRISEMNGRTPSGFFRQAEQRRHFRLIHAWYEQLREDPACPAGMVQVLFGFGRRQEVMHQALSPISIALSDGSEVEISGRSGLLSDNLDRSFVLFPRKMAYFAYKYLLQPFLDVLCLSVAGKAKQGMFPVRVVCEDGIKSFSFRIPEEEVSRDYFRNLTSDIIGHAHDYLLPLDAVLDWKYALKNGSLETLINDSRESSRNGNSCSHGPVRAADYASPWNDAAEELAMRRLGLFFETLVIEKNESAGGGDQ